MSSKVKCKVCGKHHLPNSESKKLCDLILTKIQQLNSPKIRKSEYTSDNARYLYDLVEKNKDLLHTLYFEEKWSMEKIKHVLKLSVGLHIEKGRSDEFRYAFESVLGLGPHINWRKDLDLIEKGHVMEKNAHLIRDLFFKDYHSKTAISIHLTRMTGIEWEYYRSILNKKFLQVLDIPNWEEYTKIHASHQDKTRTRHKLGPPWNTAKRKCLQRDNYTCRLCISTENVEVHHILDYWQTRDNRLQNLISLCHSCHNKVKGYLNSKSSKVRQYVELVNPMINELYNMKYIRCQGCKRYHLEPTK